MQPVYWIQRGYAPLSSFYVASSLYCSQGVKTKILAASLRDVHHVSRCLMYGAGVVTLPTKVFDKMYNHVLTDAGLAIFEEDFKNITWQVFVPTL